MKLASKEIFFISTIIAVFQLLASSQGTEISSISENTIKSLGSEVELNCTVRDLNNHTLIWLKMSNNQRNQLILTTNTILLNQNERFSVNFNEKSSTYSLKIKNLTSNDAGIYQCQIPLDENNKVSKEVKLIMERAPIIINVTSSSPSINEGESINLECKAFGLPMPEITWRRSDYKTIAVADKNAIRSKKLVVPNADKTDRGTYFCIANNGVKPIAEAPIEVTINFPPIVDTPKPKVIMAKGYNARLECHIEAYPAPTITWLKNGQAIATEKHSYPTDDFIHSYHVQLVGTEDYGYYTCRAENSLGKAETVIELVATEFIWPGQ